MTIILRNYRTGEVIRQWNQPGSKSSVISKAQEYLGDPGKVIIGKGFVEVYQVQPDLED